MPASYNSPSAIPDLISAPAFLHWLKAWWAKRAAISSSLSRYGGRLGTLLISAMPESLPPPWLHPSPSPQTSPSGCYDYGQEGAEGCIKNE